MVRLLKKLRQLLTGKTDVSDIIEDMYATTKSADDMRDIFHTNLGIISEGKCICYFDAFVEFMKGVKIDITERAQVEDYLCRQGLSEADIQQLVEEFYK